jgi:hypothetical protein
MLAVLESDSDLRERKAVAAERHVGRAQGGASGATWQT